jgi:hypothetical protein
MEAMSRAWVLAMACVAMAHAESLFDGKSLQGWRETPFSQSKPGQAKVENGTIVLTAGAPFTGVTFTGQFPKDNYEIRYEAQRVKGGDFFASLTFPVGDSFCTFVNGGWGGDIVGLSSIDGWDASDNETRTYFTFEPGKWYAFRIQVAKDRIQVWIDDQQVTNVDIGGRKVGLRYGDIKLTTPLGFASYNTTGAIRKVEYRTVK